MSTDFFFEVLSIPEADAIKLFMTNRSNQSLFQEQDCLSCRFQVTIMNSPSTA